MIDFLLSHPEKVITPLLEHISLTAITLAFSVLLASALTVLAVVMPVIGNMLTVVFSVVYSIPSLALFALMIPLTDPVPAITVLFLQLSELLFS